MSRTFPPIACAAILGLVLGGCAGGGDGGGAGGISLLPPDERSLEARPGIERSIEESDIFQVSGTALFLENPTRGFAVLDVSSPTAPAFMASLPTLVGKAGELYVRGDAALVVFKESATKPGRSEVVSVVSARTAPAIGSRLDFPGTLVASRLIGSVLYLVSADSASTYVSSVATLDPTRLSLVDQRVLSDPAESVHVTDRAVYAAARIAEGSFGTHLRIVDVSDPTGALVTRGDLKLHGVPQGRFHMDESGTTFRIVTFSGRSVGSNLFVLDVSNLDRPSILGSLEGFAPGDDLHATRFLADRVGVTTYEPRAVEIGGVDPFWMISLADPRNPTVLGRLEVPGWSDYIFPRGDRLVAVGRGDLGANVAVSLYDISDPAHPVQLDDVEFGVPAASSEANTDFRGVRIIEQGVLGPIGATLVALPYTNNVASFHGCTPDHHVQLLDLLPGNLVLRGSAPEVGLVRRTVPIGDQLYAITDLTVAAMDVSNRDAPTATATVITGDLSAPDECVPVTFERPDFRTGGKSACGAGGPDAPLFPTGGLAGLILFLLVLRRSR